MFTRVLLYFFIAKTLSFLVAAERSEAAPSESVSKKSCPFVFIQIDLSTPLRSAQDDKKPWLLELIIHSTLRHCSVQALLRTSLELSISDFRPKAGAGLFLFTWRGHLALVSRGRPTRVPEPIGPFVIPVKTGIQARRMAQLVP